MKTYNPPHIEIILNQRKMIQEFVKRRYKELYQEEVSDTPHESLRSLIESPRGSIDVLQIGDYYLSMDDVRTCQAHNIPCKVFQDRYRERLDNENFKINLRTYRKKTGNL